MNSISFESANSPSVRPNEHGLNAEDGFLRIVVYRGSNSTMAQTFRWMKGDNEATALLSECLRFGENFDQFVVAVQIRKEDVVVVFRGAATFLAKDGDETAGIWVRR